MGRFVDVFLLSILLAEPVAGAQATASEKALAEDAIRASAARYSEAYARRDARAMAALWTEDAIYVNSRGEVVRGRSNLERIFAESLQVVADGARHRDVVEAIDFITPTVVYRRGTFELLDEDGVVTRQGVYTSVMVKEHDEWLIATVHSAVPPNR
jgi:uncharacterized protein (TIGR02246 family)